MHLPDLRHAPLDPGAPLWMHEHHPGSRLKLLCGACTWSKTYDPAAIVEGLARKRLGDRQTAIAAVAHYVRWPCPMCRRMRWGTVLVTAAPCDKAPTP